MSQIYKSSFSGPVPPSVATSYTTDNGTAVPSENILEVVAIDVEDNNTNGIQVEGGLVETGASNRVQIQLTNRITGTLTTTDDTVTEMITFDLGSTPGTYVFSVKVIAYNVTSSLSAVHSFELSERTTGAAAVLIDDGNVFVSEEGAMINILVEYGLDANNFIIDVTGLPGETINWYALITYSFIS